MHARGFTPTQTALIIGIALFPAAVARPAFGFVADKQNKHTAVLIGCFLLSAIFYGCLLLIPPVVTKEHIQDIYTDTSSIVFNEGKLFLKLCELSSCELELLEKWKHNVTCRCKMECQETNTTNDSCNGLLYNDTIVIPMDNHEFGETFSPILFVVQAETLVPFVESSNHSVESCQYVQISHANYSNDTTSHKIALDRILPFKCNTSCPFPRDHDCWATNDSVTYSANFYIFALIYFVARTFNATIPNLIDAITYGYLGSARQKYGVQRVWGAVSYALFSVCAGYLMDAINFEGQVSMYICCFTLYISLSCAGALSAAFYKSNNVTTCSHTEQKRQHFVINIQMISMFAIVFGIGAFDGVGDTFRPWHLKDLGASQLLLGLCVTAACVPEIPLLFNAGRIIALVGEEACLCLSCVAYGCRLLAYSFLKNPWFVLLVEPWHFFTAPLALAASTCYGSRLTPDGMHGTMQAIITTLNMGFGEFNPFIYDWLWCFFF